MRKRTIAVVYGTRPEAIKVAPVITQLTHHPHLDPWVITTGQHKDLLDVTQKALGITPDVNLNLYRDGQSLDDLVGNALIAMGKLLDQHRPDAVVVHGDTSTTLAAALADFHHHVPVVHLEAGLRTGDIDSPFPEEANRALVARISRLHLAPTVQARQSLVDENIDPSRIFVIGNTAIDQVIEIARQPQVPLHPHLQQLLDTDQSVVTVTVHRRENWGDSLQRIGQGIRSAAHSHPKATFIAPLHPNPRLREELNAHWDDCPNIHIVDALPYTQFAQLMARSTLLLSDSGGVQEEAPVFGVPLGVLRASTERPEVIRSGQAVLLGDDPHNISWFTHSVLENPSVAAAMSGQPSPFGDGHASERAVQAISNLFHPGQPPAPYQWQGTDRGSEVEQLLNLPNPVTTRSSIQSFQE